MIKKKKKINRVGVHETQADFQCHLSLNVIRQCRSHGQGQELLNHQLIKYYCPSTSLKILQWYSYVFTKISLNSLRKCMQNHMTWKRSLKSQEHSNVLLSASVLVRCWLLLLHSMVTSSMLLDRCYTHVLVPMASQAKVSQYFCYM